MKNWKSKLEYYLENEDERKRIAMNGYKTAMKYHTNDARAKSLIKFLKKHGKT